MKRTARTRVGATLTAIVLAAVALTAAPAASQPRDGTGPTVYVGTLSPAQLTRVSELGVDREDLRVLDRGRDGASVEVVLDRYEAGKLVGAGLPLAEKKIHGVPVSRRAASSGSQGGVFRSYSAPGGIRDEMTALAAAYPGLAKLETIGRTVQGQPILALKISKGARQVHDGRRPSVLYIGAQHAREWITVEMVRRLMHRTLESYATDAVDRSLVDTRELWFVPVSNPDGYDYTFTPGNRLWRKNLRDNDGDGKITDADGVDLNRNFAYHWGYDDEGSSSAQPSQTYRGPGPGSEPETKAMDGLFRRLRPAFLLNYHSAAELLLYGTGFQVSTPTPDDQVLAALAGDNAHRAVPGYDPDPSSELYTTNGDTDDHAHERYGVLPFTAEMTTCETASAQDPDDAFDPADCESGFNFPDSEPLIEAEFEKNVPFALSLARSAATPADPTTVTGRTVPDFSVDSFSVSYGDPQPVSVTARRDLRGLRLHYSVEGRRTVTVPVREWRGGSRYGGALDTWFAEFRGVVHGARPGDDVKVWFTGRRPGHPRSVSTPFTYRLAEDTRHQVLVVADEDYRGVNPTYPASVTAPKYASAYLAAVRATGRRASLWDVTKQGVPDHLGVLGHFASVVWYLGDNRLDQDAGDEVITVGDQQLRDAEVAPGRGPHDRGTRLPERGRHAGPHRGDRGLLRHARA